MKKHILTICSAGLLSIMSFNLSAQSFETGYFLDNYSFCHRINPALQSETNVVGIMLSDIRADLSSSLGIGNIFFPRNGKLVYGLNSAVSSQDFLSGIQPVNSLVEDSGINFLSIGFYSRNFKSYHTIEVNSRICTTAQIPFETFQFLKDGGNKDYSIAGLGMDASAYVDLSYGFSRIIGKRVKIGVKVKFLIGGARMNLSTENFQINGSDGNLSASGTARLRIAQPAFNVSKNLRQFTVDNIKFGSPSIAGLGAAFDLGILVAPIDGLEASLALVDLGGISWDYGLCGESEFGISTKDVQNSTAKVDDLMKFEKKDGVKEFGMLPMTINGGVRYRMPFYQALSAGVLATYKNYAGAPCFNTRIGATISPADWFSFTANFGAGTYGKSFGTAFSITGGILNLYLGAETFLGKMMNDVPLPLEKSKVALNAGITLRFGGKTGIK